ncbi:hypothetical protein RMATCC62417_12666 [Rhizopus microsporus]|nr:hypothetical protein RMATCC62417_12666 [Rhizopus microsporus]
MRKSMTHLKDVSRLISTPEHNNGTCRRRNSHLQTLLQAFQPRPDPPTDLRDVPWSNLCEHVSPNLTEPIDHVGSHAIVYIATDHKDLRGENSRLLEWFDYFPCTLTLNDIPPELLNPLDQMHCMFSPSKPLKSFLIPLVDAMVAAHARRIFTTPRSTFSKYIGELNEAWVLKEQGYTLDSFS